MSFPRRAGLLLHPTSLPGPFGIGDLGPAAARWVDTLAELRLGLWQVLPLGPTGYGDSPYQCFSAFAGNPYLVSPEAARDDGLLTAAELADGPRFGDGPVDFGPVIAHKLHLLGLAHARFTRAGDAALRSGYERFRAAHAGWLEDFALFMALKEANGWKPWTEWAPELARREPAALARARETLAPAIDAQCFRQFLFFRQWDALRARAAAAGVAIVGDIPIFVAHDSADVWAHPQLFALDAAGRPTVVAGVPPDYFSPTGQLWGNPLYRWDVLRRDGYAWWIERLRAILAMVDVVRLDHFRGFDTYWEVPGDAPTAESGRWVEGPADDFFRAVRAGLGRLPIIAEDLGDVRPEVYALRDRFELPGMVILQFAFGDPSHPFLPHHHVRNSVVYSGTHDNDTTRGWYATAPEQERDFARRYLARDGHDIAWDLVREAFRSVADTAIVPLQDVLDLPGEARMNLPGRPSGNWSWRFRWEQFDERPRARLREMVTLYQRGPVAAEA